jgi:hypothetical protein
MFTEGIHARAELIENEIDGLFLRGIVSAEIEPLEDLVVFSRIEGLVEYLHMFVQVESD